MTPDRGQKINTKTGRAERGLPSMTLNPAWRRDLYAKAQSANAFLATAPPTATAGLFDATSRSGATQRADE